MSKRKTVRSTWPITWPNTNRRPVRLSSGRPITSENGAVALKRHLPGSQQIESTPRPLTTDNLSTIVMAVMQPLPARSSIYGSLISRALPTHQGTVINHLWETEDTFIIRRSDGNHGVTQEQANISGSNLKHFALADVERKGKQGVGIWIAVKAGNGEQINLSTRPLQEAVIFGSYLELSG